MENKKVDFCHLHNHSHFSLLDGLSSPKVLAKTASEMGFSALALTDHGSCAGLLEFQKACEEYKIKPIMGCEFYTTADHRNQTKDSNTYHLILLAKNYVGIKNLMHLGTYSERFGKYRKPRIDIEMLASSSEGLICSTACSAGELPIRLLSGDEQGATKFVEQYKSIFKDDFYLEIMMHKYHEGNKDQEVRERKVARLLYDMGKKHNVKVIATNDAHYARRDDAKYHDVLLAMQTHDHIKNPKRFTFNGDEFYLRPYEEMQQLYSSVPEVLKNTMEIYEKVEGGPLLYKSEDLLPDFKVPQGYKDEAAYLKDLVKDGMKSKGFIDKPEYRARIKFEMDNIIKCGYIKYFLVLWDIISFAKRQGVRVGAGRGSAVGSLVLYVLDITKLDPIKYDLLFERFINPERISPPDVDVDFDYVRRDEIYQYIYDKYGQDHCSKIGTYNTFGAKAVIRYGSKALDLGKDWEAYTVSKAKNPSVRIDQFKASLDVADRISKEIPLGPNGSIENTLKTSDNFRRYMKMYPDLLDVSRHIEGTVNSAGVHPAGIVICKNPIDEHIPLRESKGQICSQFNGPEVEELGLLKFDFLAIKTLTLIENTVKMIRERHGIDIDVDNLEPNDSKVFDFLNGKIRNMDNRGIFQFESGGIASLLRSIRVDTFEDMIVANALYRPGPLGAGVHDLYCEYKHGRKEIKYLHPKMGEVLKNTYGIMVYQEDLMKVSQELAGFTKGQSDTLRKVIGKKKIELIKKEHLDEKFIEGCKKNGISENVAKEIFKQIEFFGGYGFNRCLSGDTLVENKIDGFKYNLKDLCDFKFGRKYNPKGCRDIVLDSYVNGNIVEDDLVEVFETGEQELYEVELENGMVVKCTMEHKFYCSDGDPHTLKEIIEKDLDLFMGKVKYYFNSYDSRLWHASILNGCDGYLKGKLEWAVIDDDGGICIALCPNKTDAEVIAEKLNGIPTFKTQKSKIKSVKSVGKQMTYNVEMEGNQHNYKIVNSHGACVYSKNSHSCAYSFLAYQTAYLKVYYPIEFMCNLLSSELNSGDKNKKMDLYFSETTRMGICIKHTDLNLSKLNFTIEKGISDITGEPIEYIRSPLNILDGVGDKAANEIVSKQPFSNLKDFLSRVDLSKVDVRVFQKLVEKKCLPDSWEKMVSDKVMDNYHKIREEIDKEKASLKKEKSYLSQFSGGLFDDLGNVKISL